MKILAPLNPDTLWAVREILVDVLGVDEEELSSTEANFYHDLGGESIDVLDLTFHIEKRWGIKLAARAFADRVATLSKEQPVDAINHTLRSEFPLASGIALEAEDLADLKRMMTVGFIVYMVEYELATRAG